MHKDLIRRFYWRLLRVMGFKKLSWDMQFAADVWCRGRCSEHTLKSVCELSGGGVILEFGAGEGMLPLALPKGTFSEYVGYDISEVAVQRATTHAKSAGLTNCRFEQKDMAAWEGACGVSLIVLEESIYYLRPSEVDWFLTKCSNSLTPGGSILVIIHSANKHSRVIDHCRRACRTISESFINERAYLTLRYPQQATD